MEHNLRFFFFKWILKPGWQIKIRGLWPVCICFLIFNTASGSGRDEILEKIRQERHRIDQFDSLSNASVGLKDSLDGLHVDHCLFVSTEMLVQNILASGENERLKEQRLGILLSILKGIESWNVIYFREYETRIQLANQIMENETDSLRLDHLLDKNVKASLDLWPFFYTGPAAETFFLKAVDEEPYEVLKLYRQLRSFGWSKSLLSRLVIRAPGEVRGYLYSSNPVRDDLQRFREPEMVLLLDLYNTYGMNSRIYLYFQDILEEKVGRNEALRSSGQAQAVYHYLAGKCMDTLHDAGYTVKREALDRSMRMVRRMNDLHEQEASVRFREIKGLSVTDLYFLLVSGQDDWFTSSFSGVFNRLLFLIREKKAGNPVEASGWYRFRDFMHLCARYNLLDPFLKTLSTSDQRKLFQRFCRVSGSDEDKTEAAYQVLETFSTIHQDSVKRQLAGIIRTSFDQYRESDNRDEALVYRLMDEIITHALSDSLKEDRLLPFNTIAMHDTLYELILLYGDKDGNANFNSLMKVFSGDKWKIENYPTYCRIRPKQGKPMVIFLTRPAFNMAAARDLRRYFGERQHQPEIVIHRGHSYYAKQSVTWVSDHTALVFLGSCGSATLQRSILERNLAAQVISTRQTGIRRINNTLLMSINNVLLDGRDLNWQEVWATAGQRMKADRELAGEFRNYQAPGDNFGALFLRKYTLACKK